MAEQGKAEERPDQGLHRPAFGRAHGAAAGRMFYFAPSPVSMTRTVSAAIRKSSQGEKFLT